LKILLTGPTGFIGATFARLALSRGHHIAGLIIPAEKPPADLPPAERLTWIRGTLDDAPWGEIAAFAPEMCVHTAWITTPGVYLESPENLKFRDASLQFIRRLLDAGANHIVGLGTCIEYKLDGNQPLSETTTPIEPTTTYSRCKNELRLALEADARERHSGFCWARVFYPYGPREHPSRLCSSIIRKLAANEQITLKTPESTKDYIFIDDLAAALLTVVERRFQGLINLGTGIGLSVRTIARTIAEMMHKPALVKDAVPPEADPLGYVVADATRLRSLGWKPAYDLERGLRRCLEWIG
jgi:nucleoside-diphosphate-sugar epimerase